MKRKAVGKGFSLIEIMIVITIVAILIALAVPNYTRYVRTANRGEAHQLLLNWANNQEIWRAAHTSYADGTGLAVPTHARYTFSVSGTSGSTFTLTATPTGDQLKDQQRGTSCNPLTLDQSNDKTPTVCW
jgi:type IV pilus assembly protein PilE